MSRLLQRASLFLQKSGRFSTLADEAGIRDIFLQSDTPLFAPLIDFQLTYGG